MRRETNWRRRRAVLGVLAFLILVPATPGHGSPATESPPLPPAPISITVVAGTGDGRIQQPGRPCSDNGDGAYWHYDYGASLTPGVFSSLAGETRVHLDLHSDVVRYPNTGGPYSPPPAGPTAFLAGAESHASLLNDRGTLKLRLSSGDCDAPTLAFNGSVASGQGTWEILTDGGAGAYEGTTGSGTFTLTTAEVNPGADNALNLQLNGTILPLQPSLLVEFVTSYWGGLGVDYLSRRPTVVYRITNTGPGATYGASVSAQSPTQGATVIGDPVRRLGDLAPGESAVVTYRWQLGLLQPCNLILLGCDWTTTMIAQLPDALDRANQRVGSVPTSAPDLPPPL